MSRVETEMPHEIGPYRIARRMGEGGMAVVYQGVDTRSGRQVALKLARTANRVHRELLRREIALLERLGRTQHPGVVRLLDSGAVGATPWYAMALVPGVDLAVLSAELRRRTSPWQAGADRLPLTESDGITPGPRARPAPAGEVETVFARVFGAELAASATVRERCVPVLRLMAQISRTLAFVHEQGVVHADLTPANIVVGMEGVPVLVDFGTAHCGFVDGVSREATHADELRHGTPAYMAPEKIRGEPIDARCDLYALGCILFELVAGQPPFVSDGPDQLRSQHLRVAPRRLSAMVRGVDPRLDELVDRLLQKDVERRLGYAEDVALWLERVAGLDSPAPDPFHAGRRQLYLSRLVGREAELALLCSHLDRAMASRGGVLLVGGESGVGKTRLVNELGGRGAARGVAVVVGQCTAGVGRAGGAPSAASAPLQPFLPLLRQIADACLAEPGIGDDAQQALRRAATPLVPFEPALRSIPGLGGSGLPEPMTRGRVLHALATCIRLFAALRPLLVLVDDLQWADELTLEFLGSPAARGLASAPAVIVATFREEEIAPAFLEHWRASSGDIVRLARLDREHLLAMAKGMLASSLLPEELPEALYRQSEGNPFFAAEYLRGALETGYLVRTRDGQWATVPDARAAFTTATSAPLQGGLPLRLASLSPAAGAIAELGALLGREFHLEMLGQLAGSAGTSEIRRSLDDLVIRRVVDEIGPGHYRFIHDKLREGFEHGLPPERRKQLHRAAALGLQGTSDEVTRPPGLDASIGRHWVEAGEPAEAISPLQRAAQRYEAMQAVGEAIDLYDIACEQAQLAAARSGPAAMANARRAYLAEAAGDLLVRVARHLAARERYALALAHTEPGDILARGRLLRKRGRSFWLVHQYEEANTLLRESRGLLDSVVGADPVVLERELIEVYQNLFWTGYFARQTGAEAEELVSRLRDTTARNGTIRQRAMYHQCAACLEMAQTRYLYSPTVVEHARRALSLLEGASELSMDAGEARFELAFALILGGADACGEAATLLESSAQTAERLEDMTNRARALAYLAIARRRLGDIAQTRAAAEKAAAAAEEAGLFPYLGVAFSCLAWVAWRAGDIDRARTLIEDACSWWERAGHAFPFRWLDRLLRLELQTADGNIASARATVAELLATDQQQLPEPIDAALRRAHGIGADASLREAHEALMAALAEARRGGFV